MQSANRRPTLGWGRQRSQTRYFVGRFGQARQFRPSQEGEVVARASSKDTLRQTLLWWGPLGPFRISRKHARARPCVRSHACPHTRKHACENDPRPRGPPTSARSHARNLSDCVSPSHASHLRLPRTSARGLSCLPARSHALRNAPSVARLLYRPVTRQRRTHRCRATPGQNSRDSRAVVFASPAARTFTTNHTFPTTLADPGAKATNLAARTRQHCPTVECASPPSRSAFGRTPPMRPPRGRGALQGRVVSCRKLQRELAPLASCQNPIRGPSSPAT